MTELSEQEVARLEFIAKASYIQILYLWRFSPLDSSWFVGPVGKAMEARFTELRSSMSPDELSLASKRVGWEQ